MWKTLGRDPIVRIGLIVLLLLVIPYLAPVLSAEHTFVYADLYADLPLLLVAILAFEYRLSCLDRVSERRFWHLMSAGFTSWVAVRLLYALVPVDSWYDWIDFSSDLLYLFFYLSIVLAIEARPHAPKRYDASRALRGLESAGTIFFIFGLLVYFVIIPSTVNIETYQTFVPSLLLYVVLDAYLAIRFAHARRLSACRRWRSTYGWLALTAVLWTATDLVEALQYAEIVPWAWPGSLPDLFWYPPFLTVIVAARLREHFPGATTARSLSAAAASEGEALRSSWSGPLVAYVLAFPLIHLGFNMLGLLDPRSRSAREVCLLLALIVLGGMAVAYQRLLVKENRRLAQEHQSVTGQLQLSQRMEALGRLAGGIAHDFNNLLMVINGYCDLLLRGAGSDGSFVTDVEEIKRASDRAAALTDSLLTVSRRRVIEPKVLDLNAVIEGLSEMVRRLISENINLELVLDPNPGRVKADRGQIEQVILNLVVNARDAMPEGGSLIIETRKSHLDEAYVRAHPGVEAGSYVSLVIIDTGCGMDADVASHIFEPFFTTKGPGEGTGLGLSTSYSIVAQSGGHIDVKSAPGAGTTLEIFLPAVEAAIDVEETVASVAAVSAASETILLVEDEVPVRSALGRMLSMNGYEVLEAGGGEEALEVSDDHTGPIHMLLTDLVMPGMDGSELAELLRGRRPAIKTLFISGYAGDVVTRLGTLQDGAAFLAKPFAADTLLQKVRHLLDGWGDRPP
ncbi:MAG: ATP-binding protein [Acidobacteriota bacterium]